MRAGLNAGIGSRKNLGGGAPGSPTNTVAPTISGTATVGQTLTATTGTWTGSPSSYSYVWKRNGTVIGWQTGNTCLVPANAAGMTITCEVTATNGIGPSAPASSAATASVARTYLASDFASATGIWSPCLGIVSGYAGNLIDIVMDGVTLTCGQTSQGLLDIPAIIAWWQARISYTGYGGVMPRVSRIYCQGATATAHLEQTNNVYRPILDLNNVQWDGTIPIAMNGFNGRSSMWDGSDPQYTDIPVPVAEVNTYMQVAASTLAFKTCEHTVAIVAEGLSNIGTSSSGPQCYLAGMKAVTSAATNNWGLRSGTTNWAGPYGFGVTSGTTMESPASTLRAPAGRMLVSEVQTVTVTNTIDGFTPASNAVVNIRVNNDTAQEWTANTAVARSASAGSSGFFSLGRGPTGVAATTDGTGFAFYAMVYFNNPVVTGSGGGAVDNRSACYSSLMGCMGVRNDDTTVVSVFGASSSTGYAGNSGMSFATRLRQILGPKVRVQVFALTGARISANMVPNKTALATASFVSGKRNIGLLYSCAPDIGQNTGTGAYYTGAQTQDYAVELMQAMTAAGYYKEYISTFVTPGFTSSTNPIGPAACQAEVANFNAEVTNAANQAADGYTAVDVVTLMGPSAADYLNYHYNDSSSHPRTELTHGMMATYYANAIAPDVV